MLFMLLKAGALKAERGDVIIFNNTAAEHPATYEFTAKCKALVEEKYGIPFLWIEFMTYEDARKGRWQRISSYRLVKPVPKEQDPEGYQSNGEVFEEVLSHLGFLPSREERVCTLQMKIMTTEKFLQDWFAAKPGIERLGHFGNRSRVGLSDLYQLHRKNNGETPEKIFNRKKAFLIKRPYTRHAQTYENFTTAGIAHINNSYLASKRLGKMAPINGEDCVEYVSFLGIRADEEQRVTRIRARQNGTILGNKRRNPDGENVYMPLWEAKITKKDVLDFWNRQPWDLQINGSADFSNCVFCFLKGGGVLHSCLHDQSQNGNGVGNNSPAGISWWINMEKKYGRDLIAEKRNPKNGNKFIGFFGVQNGQKSKKITSYKDLKKLQNKAPKELSEEEHKIFAAARPCDCTD